VSNEAPVQQVFDGPSLWRLEAAEALGLTHDELIAAMSPGPAFPAVLHSLTAAFEISPNVIVDLGAGTGGVSEWLRLATGATVYAMDSEHGACRAARRLFPELYVLEGQVDCVPIPNGVADAVVMSGVTSLMTDLGPAIAEVDRILSTAGHFAIADLFNASDVTSHQPPNVFRSGEDLTRMLHKGGFTVTNAGFGEPVPDPAWADAADAVDEWICTHCTDRAGYPEWKRDRRHLQHHIESGHVLGGCIVAERTRVAQNTALPE